jgi:ABC-type glycerol-3-phosphate transport system substrate-binding protein
MAIRPTALSIALALLAGCVQTRDSLTVVLALLPSELPAYREIVADFERTAGWTVTVVPQQYPDIRRALAAESAAGSGTIDLVELDVYSLAPAALQVRRITGPFLDGLLRVLEPETVAAGTIDGLRFLPHRVSWQALVYDHEVLGEPPETWPELLEVARSHPGKIGMKAAAYEGLTCDVLPFVWSAGGSGDVLDDAGALRAFDFFAELAPYLDPRSATFKEATIAEAMAHGEIVLHMNWPFVMSLYASEGLAPERFRAAPLPRGPDERATVLGGGYLAIPENAPHPEAALRFLRFLLGRPAQERLARELGWFSARRDVPFEDGSTLLAGYAEMRGDVRPRPERSDYPEISRAWQRAFRRVAFDGVAPAVALREGQEALAGREGGDR